MTEKLQSKVQKAILGKLEPENMGELIRLMEYLEKIDNNTFLNAEQRWHESKKSRYKRFVTLLDRLLDLDPDTFDNVKRAAYIAFIQEPRDIGEICRTWLEDELPDTAEL